MVTSHGKPLIPKMNVLKYFFIWFALLTSGLLSIQESRAEHFHSAEIYWECLTTGPDAGKFKFYVIIYKDCASASLVNPPQLTAENVPAFTSLALTLASGYPQDVTPEECGFSCADGIQDISLEKYMFETAPVAVPGPPPPSGYTFYYEPCCRIDADNLVNSQFETTYYAATMYPYNNQNTDPCYDSSPQFAEPPSSIHCAGYEIRYNTNAIDSDLDSLTYEFTEALVGGGVSAQYQPGFSAAQPLPGPATTQLNPTTGQIEYDSPNNVAGRYTVVLNVNAWRCGQLISRSVRDMTFAFMPCSEQNNVTQVAAPNWTSPPGASGFDVTVQAGDLVSFTLEGVDNDVTGGNPQTLEFTAEGAQFSNNFTNPNSGCQNTPCATLTNSTPPTTATGSISTEFNWQTDCNHVGIYDNCGNLSNTYNFLFKYRDNFCPASASRIVNVAVTVVGEEIIESPQPHCVSTDANGDITVSWDPVTDNANPPSFVEYIISHSTSPNGPFQEIATIADINTGTYTHAAGNPVVAPTSSGPNYYFIQTRSGCDDSVVLSPVDTVSSIFLTVTDNTTTADLSWTAVATPPLASSNGNGQGLYQVYREYPAGNWEAIGTTFNLTYSDPVVWCNEQVNYRVELTDNLPCTSVSNVAGEVLSNATQPAPQPIDSVTVDPATGHITICWPPNQSQNVVQYNVLLNPDAFAWVPMDTVFGYNNTCWTDTVSDASSQSLWYQVFATNDCDIPGVPAGTIADGTDHHKTMLLEADYDSCAQITTLNWTPYWYWPEGISEYQIFASLNSGAATLIGTASDTSFVHTDLQASAEYCYFVRAVRNGDGATASSNGRCLVANVPKRPEYDYQYRTTVQEGNTGVETYFFVDSTAGYLGFDIQRGETQEATSTIWFTAFDPSTRYYDYVDAGARPAFNSYYYRIIGVDSCDQNADTLNLTRTILLEAEPNANRTNSLEWNAYEGFDGQVVAYNIYRSFDGPFTLLTTVPPTQLTYVDSVQEIIEGEGNFCYYIEAVEGAGNPIGNPNPVTFLETSRSNEDCARQTPNVFVPNAFMPEGVNNVFKPITVYVQSESYLFQVYDRWGNRIFETVDPEQGWNGNGYPQGAYVYFISFLSSNGDTYTKSGSVTLLR